MLSKVRTSVCVVCVGGLAGVGIAAAQPGRTERPSHATPDSPPNPSPVAPEAEPLPTPPVSFPHPLITEVLYAVPTKHGDANLDGERQTTGDEFVELINPHARPIRIGGYTLVDAAPSGGTQFRFIFPPMTLQPGQVVVVFNGHDANIKGPIGDSATPPRERHPAFGNAWVLTARARSTRAGFANTADYVMLLDPKDQPIQCVLWGDAEDPKLSEGQICLIERVPTATDGSVQRRGIEGGFIEHPPYRPEGAGMEVALMTFSPGVFVVPGLTRLEDLPPYKGER
jgi:hypothetical protein